MGLFGFGKRKKEKTDNVLKNQEEEMKKDLKEEMKKDLEEEVEKNPDGPKRILVCDDAAFMRMMIKDVLQKAGYEIAGEAENGKKALMQYRTLKPDLLILDITMPEMDGLEALKEIRKMDPKACVIMCSAMGQQSMVAEALRLGAKDFVVKPFHEDDVKKAVQKALQI